MQADLKHKRKAAGFIRTNSSKALPTFKLPNKSSSSDDFSSFEDSPNRQAHPQQSDSQFSPYKNTVPAVQPYRPPLPPTYPESRSNLAQKQGVQVQSQVFSNQKLRRNYQTGNYLESPGKIVDRSNRNSRILRDREEQIRETLRKRVEVEKELAQIDKICQEIEHIKDPHQKSQHSKEKYGKEIGGKPKSMEKYVSETSKMKPSFSQQKHQYKYKDQPVYELPRSPKQPLNSENRNILNKQPPQAPKPEKLPTQSYNLDQSEIHQNSSSQEGEQQYSAFQCEQTFKPNASEQILTSIEEYKKLHPEIEGNASNLRKGIRNRNQSQNQDRVRKEHERARQRFILEQQNEVSVEKEEEEISEEEEEEEGLIQEYPTQQFKKTTIKQTIEATRNLQGNSPTFGKTKANNPNLPIENSSGIHKAKGGICFDLDINQFTQQHESKPFQKQTVYVARKGKKINTKEEILKRREIAKNYDKLARAKVFSGY